MAEWSNAVDSKSIVRMCVPRVRIPLSPPVKPKDTLEGVFLMLWMVGFEPSRGGLTASESETEVSRSAVTDERRYGEANPSLCQF